MAGSLDIIIVDDDPSVCQVLYEIVTRFYIWGEVLNFTDPEQATAYCLDQQAGVAVFVLDVYMDEITAFEFLETILDRFPMAREDTIIITGNASNEIVNRCVANDITYLLEKPVRPFALQLAVRAIVSKYVKFARRLLQDPLFAEHIPML
jgi:DNA-binding NtrC family response regulator